MCVYHYYKIVKFPTQWNNSSAHCQQVPKDKVEDFKCVKTFKIFNTNNLWINLSSIRDKVKLGTLDRDVIVNQKTLDDGELKKGLVLDIE